ncbi:transposase [Mucilaginibacter mali]|uniref:Transposase n=1 Tax=Mucilaginibacter mali TaxID=2740462 RepID=A0A7D4UMQ0_9SPHI|nr:transposase [Mucilaginibacter mali]QKJ31281.1 transposase [Mucilaginibacter mali]
MSVKYKFRDQEKLYFISFAVVNWIDLFIRNDYKDIMLNSWKYCQTHKGFEIYGWCIMTSHVHMIIGSNGAKLEDIMRDMKKHTSIALKAAIQNHPGESRREWMLWMMERAGRKNSQNINFQLWQQDNHPIEIYDFRILHQKLDYIHNNPVVAGIVDKPQDYLYSSARDYYGLPGMVDIILVDPLVA